MPKIILDLCGRTGAWSKKYKEAGYRVINVTLPFYDVLETVIFANYIVFKDGSKEPLMVLIKDIYGILAAPVCTHFSFARTRAKTPRKLRDGMKLVITCLNIIWECRYDHKLAFWCLENPTGYLRQFLGKPVFTFDPCDFGDPYTKKTDLWGYFNMPKKNPVKLNGRKLPSISEITSSKQADKRAITPPDFAKAFYEANCKHKWIEDKTAGDIRFRGENSIIGNERNLNIYPIKHRPGENNPGKEGWYKDKGGLSKNPSQSSFCSLCGAWCGSLGLEPTFGLYIKHLCDIFDEVKRVLRKDGTCWVNIGDSYGGSGNAPGHTEDTKNLGYKTLEMGATQGDQKTTKQYAKCLLDIPYRFSIEMTDRGWIKRNTIIWWKLNCMPSSADDRFTIDFEYLFFFTKNNKAIFWTNEKTFKCVDKQPLGIKGIEGEDWEWRKCPNCEGTGKAKVNIKDRSEIYGENDPAGMRRGRMRDFLDKKKDMYKAGDKTCKRCKGAGKIKVSFWTGHDYWFEQQFDKYAPSTLPRMERGVNKDTIKKEGRTINMKIDFVRPVIDWYAKRMEKRLREKDKSKGKDGWHDGKLYYYLKKVSECTVIILKIIRGKENKEIKEKDIHLAIKKCIDGSNFFMMLADNLRDELIKRGVN